MRWCFNFCHIMFVILTYFNSLNSITDNNSKKGSDIATIILDIYKTINRTTWEWTNTHSYGNHIEDVA